MMWRHLAVGYVTLLLLLAPVSDGCSCIPNHPQSLYCQSDFVIVAKILRKSSDDGEFNQEITLPPVFGQIEYTVKINKILKGPDSLKNLSRKKRRSFSIFTMGNDAMCGVDWLQEGVVYLLTGRLSGGSGRINLCESITTPWKSLSRQEKNRYKRGYKNNCECQVRLCGEWGDECPQLPPGGPTLPVAIGNTCYIQCDGFSCDFPPGRQVFHFHGMCRHRRYGNGCRWKPFKN